MTLNFGWVAGLGINESSTAKAVIKNPSIEAGLDLGCLIVIIREATACILISRAFDTIYNIMLTHDAASIAWVESSPGGIN